MQGSPNFLSPEVPLEFGHNAVGADIKGLPQMAAVGGGISYKMAVSHLHTQTVVVDAAELTF